jgi:hypothetical protein
MIGADQPSAADAPSEVADNVDEAALAQVMRVVPLGAAVLAGTAVALLVIGYLAIYLLIFLPRGAVG